MSSTRSSLAHLLAVIIFISATLPATTLAAGEQRASSDPIFIQLEPITVALQQGKSKTDNYAQVKVSLEAQDATVEEAINRYLPKIQSEFILLLSSKKKSELETTTQKRLFAKDIANIVNNIIKPRGTNGVTAVHFTSFMLQ